MIPQLKYSVINGIKFLIVDMMTVMMMVTICYNAKVGYDLLKPVYVCVYIYICICLFIYIYIYIFMYVYIYMFIYIYIYVPGSR